MSRDNRYDLYLEAFKNQVGHQRQARNKYYNEEQDDILLRRNSIPTTWKPHLQHLQGKTQEIINKLGAYYEMLGLRPRKFEYIYKKGIENIVLSEAGQHIIYIRQR